jgi:PAS domain S-box-containing protein
MKTASPAVGVAPGPLLRFAPLAALVVSLVVLLALWHQVLDLHQQAARQHFELEARRITTKIQHRLDAYEQILRGAAGLYAASPDVSRAAWHRYVSQLALDQGYKGIQGVSFVAYVTASELPAHVRAIRSQGFPAYVIKPEGERPEYSSIVFIEPFDGRNLRAFGYDMLTDPVRRTAMERARDTGEVVTSGKVRLVQETETDVQDGVVVYEAVYRTEGVLQTIEQRRAALLGWVSTPYRLGDLIESILGGELDDLRLQVYDSAVGVREALMFDSAGTRASARQTPELTASAMIVVNGRPWMLRYESSPAFIAATRHVQPWVELAGISLVVALAFGLSWALVHMRRRAHVLATNLTTSLRRSEERLRAVFDHAGVGLAATDLDRRLTNVNRRYAAILGYEPHELAGVSLEHILHPDEVSKEDELRRELAAGLRDAYELERRYVRKDGRVIWCRVTAAAERDASGQMGALIGVLEDITAKREAEDRFRQIAEQSLLGIAILQDDRLCYANQAIADVLGAPLADVQRWSFDQVLDRVHPDDRSQFDVRTGPAAGEPASSALQLAYRLRTPDGEVRWVDRYSRTIQHLGRPAVLLTLVDVTERRRSAQELEEKSQHYERLMEGSRDAVYVVDREGRVREWNRAFLSHVGCSSDEAKRLRLTDFVAFRSDDEVERRTAALFDNPGRFEARHRRQDGTVREVEVDAAPIEVGGEVMLYASARDVTDRKRLEEEVTKAQKLEAIGVLAGGIAHDFNNLLAAILGHVELAMSAAGPGSTITSDLEVAKSSIGRATELTKRLLTFARGGAPVKRRLGVPKLLSDNLALALGGSAMRTELRLDDGLWEVEADEGQLGQVLSNVLLNARQAMNDTGSLSIFARNRTVVTGELAELPAGDYVQLDVQDDGPGVPEHLLPKVFDPFFTTKSRASGLGLTTAYSIVRRHGGRMWLESPPGAGAIVRILLPAVLRAPVAQGQRPLAPPPAPTEPRPIPRPRRGRVLVMDDEPAVLDSVAATLRSLGLEVDTAPEGGQALSLFDQARAERRPYDLVILDLTVVGGLGGEATNRLLRDRDPTVVTIVSSGYSDSPLLSGAERHGFAGTLAKPYSRDELVAVVDRLLECAPPRSGGLQLVR